MQLHREKRGTGERGGEEGGRVWNDICSKMEEDGPSKRREDQRCKQRHRGEMVPGWVVLEGHQEDLGSGSLELQHCGGGAP